MTELTIVVQDVCSCPLCGGNEVLLGGPVRPFKVHSPGVGWSSNCTTCGIWFSEDGTRIEVDLRFIDQGVRWWTLDQIAGAPDDSVPDDSGSDVFDALRAKVLAKEAADA